MNVPSEIRWLTVQAPPMGRRLAVGTGTLTGNVAKAAAPPLDLDGNSLQTTWRSWIGSARDGNIPKPGTLLLCMKPHEESRGAAHALERSLR